jgi:hypothetical protein
MVRFSSSGGEDEKKPQHAWSHVCILGNHNRSVMKKSRKASRVEVFYPSFRTHIYRTALPFDTIAHSWHNFEERRATQTLGVPLGFSIQHSIAICCLVLAAHRRKTWQVLICFSGKEVHTHEGGRFTFCASQRRTEKSGTPYVGWMPLIEIRNGNLCDEGERSMDGEGLYLCPSCGVRAQPASTLDRLGMLGKPGIGICFIRRFLSLPSNE